MKKIKRRKVKAIIHQGEEQPEVLVMGWVRTRRDSKGGFSFLEIGHNLVSEPPAKIKGVINFVFFIYLFSLMVNVCSCSFSNSLIVIVSFSRVSIIAFNPDLGDLFICSKP